MSGFQTWWRKLGGLVTVCLLATLLAGPTFDASLAMEFMGFSGPEVVEGLESHLEKRRPQFPPTSEV